MRKHMQNTKTKTYRPSSCRIRRQGLRQDLADLRCSLRIDGGHLGGGKNEAHAKIGEASEQRFRLYVVGKKQTRSTVTTMMLSSI